MRLTFFFSDRASDWAPKGLAFEFLFQKSALIGTRTRGGISKADINININIQEPAGTVLQALLSLCTSFSLHISKSTHTLTASLSPSRLCSFHSPILPQAHTALTHPLSTFFNTFFTFSLFLSFSLSLSHHSKTDNRPSNTTRRCRPTMPSLPSTATTMLFAITLTLPFLTTSIPMTTTISDASNETAGISHHRLAHLPTSIIIADTCPTPPTEFLPYAPPPGYVPAPGCPPASQGTQPSEDNPPAGFYGGSSSGGGSAASVEVSGAGVAGRSKGAVVFGTVSLVAMVVEGWRSLVGC